MKLVVLNGSPKGEVSVTYQLFRYIKKKFPQVEFNEFKISQNIKIIEKNHEKFDEIIEAIERANGIIWLTPVYHFTIPGQLKRFIELLFENNSCNSFKEKYATLITTSIHFYDNMAENYIQGISEDLGLKYVKGFLAEMHDLTKKKHRRMLIDFFANFQRNITLNLSTSKLFSQLNKTEWKYEPQQITFVEKSSKYKILIIADIENENSNIAQMLSVYQSFIANKTEVVNIDNITIKSGCMGCCFCGGNNECRIDDDLTDLYKNKMLNADAIIYFAQLKDRYFSAKFKMFFDRSFMHGHAPVFFGKYVQYFVSGNLSQIANLREEMKARSEVNNINLLDIITDENSDNEKLTKLLKDSAENLIYSLDHKISIQTGFYEVAAHKIFRDFIYQSKAIFAADHRFYKKMKRYDFPNKNPLKNIFLNLLYHILKIKVIRKLLDDRMKEGMIMSLKKVVEKE